MSQCIKLYSYTKIYYEYIDAKLLGEEEVMITYHFYVFVILEQMLCSKKLKKVFRMAINRRNDVINTLLLLLILLLLLLPLLLRIVLKFDNLLFSL